MFNFPIRSLLLSFVLFAVVMLALPATSFAQIGVSISFGPPPLPVYEQPLCPGEGYLWTPGYWAYDSDYDDYYWVPGTWVLAPEPGLFWTPGYWAWVGGGFRFYDGYWGAQVGFYGGINYGFGYFGEGYQGGRWDHGQFFYNRAVNNVNVTVVRNVYNTTVINNTTVTRVSYNGGNGGINARPTREQEAVAQERHVPPIREQTQHVQEARADRQLRASENHGKPPVAATARPADFRGPVVPAKDAGGTYNPPANRGAGREGNNVRQENRPENSAPRPENRPDNNARPENNIPQPGNVTHPNDIPRGERPAPVNTGDAKRDQKLQQQEEELQAKQDQDRQKLQQKQDKEHQRMEQQKADDNRKQQVEQQHQQQTQKLQQKQEQQQQKLQQRTQPQHRNESKQNESKPPKEKPQS